MRYQALRLACVIATTGLSFALTTGALDGGERDEIGARARPPLPQAPFSPSNARTEDGSLIAEAQFFTARRCASCHRDTHRSWSESLHRNAGREPFYKESVDILARTRGVEFTRHCESCHAPVALLSGALTTGSLAPRLMDDEGVSCTVCHSITEARLDGTGSYTIRRPALLAREDGTPVFGEFSDEQILADIAGHRRAMMRPLLKEAEFCAVCHKSSAPASLNGYKSIRGFSAYDEWQQSGASHQTVMPFYRRPQPASCRSCHMPRVPSASDMAAKDGLIASHSWPGANTAAPLFYGQTNQVRLTESFLKDKVLSIDIFALKSEATGRTIAPLGREQSALLKPADEVTVEVVISNRKAAHSFPPELRDLYEAWVEFEAVDAGGKTIFHSGFLNPDGSLDASAHVYKAILLDSRSRPLTRHQVWIGTVKAYDNAIPPGRSDVVRFRFGLPKDYQIAKGARLTLRARVNYRRFISEYTDYVLRRQKSRIAIPVVRMAEAEARLFWQAKARPATTAPAAEARRWNDYGIGLMEQSQYGAAADAFRRAVENDAGDPNLYVNAALAESKTERFGPAREQLGKALALLDCALRIDATNDRARFYKALVLRGLALPAQAAEEFARIATLYPRDREAQRQLGQTLYALGRLAEAERAFEAVVALDPTDAGGYQFLSPIYSSRRRGVEAGRAHSLYLDWRDDPRADAVAARFFAAHPQWAEERVPTHVHSKDSPARPTLTGPLAAPDR